METVVCVREGENMVKRRFDLLFLVICIIFISACGKGNTKEVYKYTHEEILGVSIEKTVVYSGKMVIYFGKDSLPAAEQVITYDKNFNVIEENVDFTVEKDKLIINSERASDISGLYIRVHTDEEIHVRYLDSEDYAMIVYTFVADIGMCGEGDTDTYYSEEEKQRKAEIEAEYHAIQKENFRLIEGIWANDDNTFRLEIKVKDNERIMEVYEESGEWTSSIAVIEVYEEEEVTQVTVYDDPNWGAAYNMELNKENTEMWYEGIFLKRVN